MIDPREILFGKPDLQKGTPRLFIGLFLLLGGVLALLLTHEGYWWALVALGVAVGCSGGFLVSDPTGKNV